MFLPFPFFLAGDPCELYHLVLESKSFLEKMTVLEHTIPFFLPLREAENDLLSSNAMVRLVARDIFLGLIFLGYYPFSILLLFSYFQRFIDYIGELLQAYVDRKEQV